MASDALVWATTDEGTRDLAINLAKGTAFVVVTSAVLWVTLRRWAARARRGWDEAAVAHRRFATLVEASSDLIVVLDEDDVVRYASPGVTRALDWPIEDAEGRTARDFVHPDDREATRGFLIDARAGVDGAPRTLRLLTPTGRWRRIEVVANDLRDEPAVAGVVVRGRDVTARVEAEARLHHLVHHDLVTGTSNAAGFADSLRDASLGAQARGRELAVLVVDLDAFREINEATGRSGGDQALQAIASRIAEALRPTALGRLGADEFGIALPTDGDDGRDSVAKATELAERLLQCIREPLTIHDQPIRLTATVGGAVVRYPALVDQALAVAEANLAEAKHHPDHLVISAVTSTAPNRLTGARLISDLSDAADEGQLQLHFQTQHDLRTGEVVGVESLIRWDHPVEGLLAPGSFLADAANHGLLPAITRVALAQGVRATSAWAAAGRIVPVSVNLSLGDLRRGSLVEEVLAALEASGTDPSLLCLELTEQTLLADPERSLEAMGTLRAEGIRFSIDDFGTGYSSLAHLRTLPVDELKIDRSFVSNMYLGGIEDSIVSALIDLGHRVGISVVAEGVEDLATFELLRERGCDRAQGYLMARPVAFDAVDLSPFAPEASSENVPT